MMRVNCPLEGTKAKQTSPSPVGDEEVVWRAIGSELDGTPKELKVFFSIDELKRQDTSVDRETIMPLNEIFARQERIERRWLFKGLAGANVGQIRAIKFSDSVPDAFCVHDDGDLPGTVIGSQHATLGFSCAIAQLPATLSNRQKDDFLRALRNVLMQIFAANMRELPGTEI